MFALLLAALFAAAPTAGPPPTPPILITEPDWLQKPDADTVSHAYPAMALQLSIEGHARLDCLVNPVGRLYDCKALEEQPKGLGFADAALRMSSAFQMKPKTRNGTPVANGVVKIPINFKFPDTPAPVFTDPKPTSPEAVTLARELMERSSFAEGSLARWDSYAANLEALPRRDMSEAARHAAAVGVREAGKARLAELQDQVAKLYAARLSASELKAILAFRATATGAVILHSDADARAMVEMVAREDVRLKTEETRTVFCARHDCRDPDATAEIGETRWSEQPDEAQIETFRPPPAKLLRIGGVATLNCNVNLQGYLPSCSVMSEAPRGLGLGDAAVALRSYYRLADEAIPQQAGQTVKLTIRFPTPDPAPAPTRPEPRSAHALELARAYLAATRRDESVVESWRSAVETSRKQSTYRVLSDADMAELVEAMARGMERSAPKLEDFQAAYLTHRFTDQQLIEATVFWRSPAGRAYLDAQPYVNAQTQLRGLWYAAQVLRDAGERVCEQIGCRTAPPPQSASAVKPEPSTRKP